MQTGDAFVQHGPKCFTFTGAANHHRNVVQRVFAFPGWQEAIARHWPAFLAGTRTRPDVIAAVVREIAAK